MLDTHAQAQGLGQHGVVLVEKHWRDSRSEGCHKEVLRRGDEFVVLGGIARRSDFIQVEGKLLLRLHWVDLGVGEIV